MARQILFAVDGTTYFSSHKVGCASCCVKHHKDGSITYYHQAVAGIFVYPDKKEVIPCCPEPVIIQDDTSKNDCEKNAAERALKDLRREHPHLEIIVTEDRLYSNGLHIKLLRALKLSFILTARPGDHKALYASSLRIY